MTENDIKNLIEDEVLVLVPVQDTELTNGLNSPVRKADTNLYRLHAPQAATNANI